MLLYPAAFSAQRPTTWNLGHPITLRPPGQRHQSSASCNDRLTKVGDSDTFARHSHRPDETLPPLGAAEALNGGHWTCRALCEGAALCVAALPSPAALLSRPLQHPDRTQTYPTAAHHRHAHRRCPPPSGAPQSQRRHPGRKSPPGSKVPITLSFDLASALTLGELKTLQVGQSLALDRPIERSGRARQRRAHQLGRVGAHRRARGRDAHGAGAQTKRP